MIACSYDVFCVHRSSDVSKQHDRLIMTSFDARNECVFVIYFVLYVWFILNHYKKLHLCSKSKNVKKNVCAERKMYVPAPSEIFLSAHLFSCCIYIQTYPNRRRHLTAFNP